MLLRKTRGIHPGYKLATPFSLVISVMIWYMDFEFWSEFYWCTLGVSVEVFGGKTYPDDIERLRCESGHRAAQASDHENIDAIFPLLLLRNIYGFRIAGICVLGKITDSRS